jgi:hypothetical protein
MCFPAIGVALGAAKGTAAATQLGIAATTAAIGAASAGMQFVGARRQAQQQARNVAQAQAAEQRRKQEEITSIRMREQQEAQALAEELNQINLRTQAGAQRDVVARGERGGIVGQTAQAAIGDWFRQQGAVNKALLQQKGFGGTATAMALEQAELASQQRQIGIRSQRLEEPSLLGGFLSLAQSGLQGYALGSDIGSRVGNEKTLGQQYGGSRQALMQDLVSLPGNP